MYYDSLQRYKKRILFAIALFFIVCVVWTIVIFTGRIGKLPVVVAVVPSNATITIDNQHYGNGTQWLKPGTYKVTVSKDGFTSSNESTVVTDKKSQNVIAVSLKAESDEAKKWAAEHQKEYSSNEQYGAIEASADGKYFADTHPITTKLPFNDPYFTIGYTVDKDDSVTLTVATPSPRYRFYAVEKIRQLGFDPTDFKIVFKDFHNPLEQK